MIRIHVVRHGHIPGYEGDVPLTDEGWVAARRAGRQLAEELSGDEVLSFVHGPARRARETALGIYEGLRAAEDVDQRGIEEPSVHPGLRNLGFLVDGAVQEAQRPHLDMAIAAYEADPSSENEARLAYQRAFWASDDPIGYWLQHPSPYAEDPEAVAARVRRVLRELLSPVEEGGSRRIICATHAAPMRAFLRPLLGGDPGEPDYCEQFVVEGLPGQHARLSFRDHEANFNIR